jgi:hypothetical protein
MFDPWTALADDWPGTDLYYRHLPERWGQTVWDENGVPHIELAIDMGRVQQRCTLTHEIGHLVAGKPCVSLCDRNEQDVIEWTARILLPDLGPVAGLLRRHPVTRAAERLHVTVDILNDRVITLNDDEREMMTASVGTVQGGPDVLAAHGHPRRDPPKPHACRATRALAS